MPVGKVGERGVPIEVLLEPEPELEENPKIEPNWTFKFKPYRVVGKIESTPAKSRFGVDSWLVVVVVVVVGASENVGIEGANSDIGDESDVVWILSR